MQLVYSIISLLSYEIMITYTNYNEKVQAYMFYKIEWHTSQEIHKGYKETHCMYVYTVCIYLMDLPIYSKNKKL